MPRTLTPVVKKLEVEFSIGSPGLIFMLFGGALAAVWFNRIP